MYGILLPICVACIMPIVIVWIVMRTVANSDNKRAEVLIEAIRNNTDIDTEKLTKALGKSARTPEEELNMRLLRGCISLAVGIAAGILSFIFSFDLQNMCMIASAIFLPVGIGYLIVYFVSRKSITRQCDNIEGE